MTEAAETDQQESKELDISAFEAVFEAAIEKGSIPQEKAREAYDEVREAYRALETRRERAAVRRYMQTLSEKAVMKGEFDRAQRVVMIRKVALRRSAPANPVTPRPKVNPTQGVVDSIVSIAIGYAVANALASVDDRLDTDWEQLRDSRTTVEVQTEAMTYARWLQDHQKGEEPKVSELAKSAARIALGRSPKGQGRKPYRGEPKPPTPTQDQVAAAVDFSDQGTDTPAPTDDEVEAFNRAMG